MKYFVDYGNTEQQEVAEQHTIDMKEFIAELIEELNRAIVDLSYESSVCRQGTIIKRREHEATQGSAAVIKHHEHSASYTSSCQG
ncbi:hypothetical protein GOP47_0000977 [Adiantum capillus-veneris]|uniref:Uncharacterized protein n=1 Tax=Adiantum capillus-veneris TaxID=13818 RepID=A0A9D4VEJ0_ADICA|nr:hypothetical protein GOP47_0000977 [Adiantum capillus-veneris]